MLSRLARLTAYLGHARARLFLVVCGTLVCAVVCLGAVLLILDLRHAAVAEAKRNLNNLALVLSVELDLSLQALDLVELGLIESMRQSGIDTRETLQDSMASRQAHQNLQDRIAALAHVESVALFDVDGRSLNLSASWPVPHTSIADREYFPALIADPPAEGAEPVSGLLIAGPIVSRTTGKTALLLLRRFTARDGHLLAIVGGAIEPASFERLFSHIAVTNGGAFALFLGDGTLVARHPHLDGAIGNSIAATDAYPRILAALDRSVFTEPGVFDGRLRLVAPHSLTHYPMIVVASAPVDAVLAGWRSHARSLAGVVVLMELVIGGTIVLGVRHLRGYEKLEAAGVAQLEAEAAQARAESELVLAQQRESASCEMHKQQQRFDTALNNMLQGLMMFDDVGRLLVVNHRFCEMFEIAADALPAGMGYGEMTERIVALGNITAEDMKGVRERRAALISRNQRATATWEVSGGRAFTVTHQPMEGGWLSTYEDITDRRLAEARMAHLARHDALTDLPNRVLFREKLEEAIVHVRRGHGLALLCLDLDQFKAVNDTLGHPIGDALLQAVAGRLLERTRDTDTVARLGGDEFAIVQTPIDQPTEATALAGRLIELLDAPFEVAGHQIVIGTSIGIAYAPQDGMDPDQLLKCADLALYRAKVDGRGIYRLFHAEMDARMQVRRRLELDLRQALKVGQLELFYQPLIDLNAGVVAGFEALLRWRHPEKGIVPPNQFIPLAEEIGLIIPIGEWVLREACKDAACWEADMRIAVNLSPAQFKSRNLVAAVAQALREADLPPNRLELEITETVMLQDTDATLATLRQLQALGARIAMDDFGTGYSSLSYLRRFPFDRIKIDQSFIHDLCTKQDCGAIVRAVAGMSNELGIATTAEGVETQEQLDALTLAGCSEVQGYLFSPAVPRLAVPALLRTIAGMLPAREVRVLSEHVG